MCGWWQFLVVDVVGVCIPSIALSWWGVALPEEEWERWSRKEREMSKTKGARRGSWREGKSQNMLKISETSPEGTDSDIFGHGGLYEDLAGPSGSIVQVEHSEIDVILYI